MNTRNEYIKNHNSDVEWRQQDAKRVADNFENKAYVVDGIVRWSSNDHIPPSEILEFWEYIGKDFDRAKCEERSSIEVSAFLTAYREREAKREKTLEEMAEMKSVFGEGVTVVNVVTGEKFKI